jgi:putative peptidoglycan lipid II flippase
MSKQKIAKSASIISLATALSRVFGYVRDLVIAFFFGTGTSAQAFVVAFRIPNLLRQLVGEGAVGAALVPVFSEYLSVRSEDEFKNLSAALFSIFSVILIALVGAGIIFTPFIVRLIAPGFIVDEHKFALTVKLTRFLFPYILLVGLGAFCMGALHTLGIFAPSSFGPVFLNISIIAAALFLRKSFSEPVISLAVGVLIGGVLQLGIQLPPLIKKGMRLKFMWKAARDGIIRIGRLLFPRAIGTAVYQLNIFVDTILASFVFIVGEGAVAALYFSNRIIQLPLGLFAISLATAALPTMSIQAARGEINKLKETISFSLRGVMLVMLPATAGLFVLAKPLTSLLFEWGAFGNYSTDITSIALFFYAFGLFAYAGTKILVGGFYAMQDTITPVKVATGALLVNILFNLILMWKLKAGGLALATALSSIFNFGMLFFILDKKLNNLDREKIGKATLKILFSAIIMGIFCYLFFALIDFSFISSKVFREIARVSGTIIFSIFIFMLCAYAFKVEQVRVLSRWILKKR